MKKTEVKTELLAGKTIEELFSLSYGDSCMIYQADRFFPGEEIIYIPDLWLNEIQYEKPIRDPEEIEAAIDAMYTGNDFVELCHGDAELAERLFWYCRWQHPSSALPELEDD